jgi:hypothetical protein
MDGTGLHIREEMFELYEKEETSNLVVWTYVIVGRGTVWNLSVSTFPKCLVHMRHVGVASTLTGDRDNDRFYRILEMHVVGQCVPVFTCASKCLRADVLGNLILELVNLHLVRCASHSWYVFTVAHHNWKKIKVTPRSKSTSSSLSTYDCVCCGHGLDWHQNCSSSSLSISATSLRSTNKQH